MPNFGKKRSLTSDLSSSGHRERSSSHLPITGDTGTDRALFTLASLLIEIATGVGPGLSRKALIADHVEPRDFQRVPQQRGSAGE
jgi:hypothetical protein